MRILIVTQYFWPENFRINDLALGLRDKGHSVSVLTGYPNYPDGKLFPGYRWFGRKREEHDGITIHRVPMLPRGRNSKLRLGLNYLSFALSASLLGPFRCRGAYDLIFVYEPSPVTVGLPAIVMKKRTKAPILFWVQDLWPETVAAAEASRSRWVLALLGRLVRFVYRRCDCILVQSRAFTDAIEKQGVAPSQIRYFPNSAEGLYRPIDAAGDCPEAELMPAGFRVMFAGNIGAAQDFATILAAAESLRDRADIHWVILGDGREAGWARAEAARRGLEGVVHFLGVHPVERMPYFFALADTLLVTLRKHPVFVLTIPSKLQSYLACGRPVVAALDGEGARVIQEAQAGFAAEPGEPAALAGAVLAMYHLPEEKRREMGQRARAYFEENFEREKLLGVLDGWMREFAGEAAQ